jgi:twitching motility protein PilT
VSLVVDQYIGQLIVNWPKLSDLHLQENQNIAIRIDGTLTYCENTRVSKNDLDEFLKEHLNTNEYFHFESTNDLDFAFILNANRLRACASRNQNGLAVALRLIPNEIPSIHSLGLPESVLKVVSETAGLVLITGATGSGKSTTAAALIDKINRSRGGHIVTIEDPIEHLHNLDRAVISQRQVGRDTNSFAKALRAALRQDPDVIYLGEMRDLETISLALTAAETGHLVIATLHTNDAPSAINRIVSVFSAQEQEQVRSQLSQSLRMVIAQKLIRKRSGGRVACFEVLINVSSVGNLIRENKIFQLKNIINTNESIGMISIEKSIAKVATMI